MRARLKNECDRYWRFIHKGEWDRVRVMSSSTHPEVNGKFMSEIATLWEQDPWECYFDLLQGSLATGGHISGMAILFTDEHLKETISHPLFSLAVDGWTSRVKAPSQSAPDTRSTLPAWCTTSPTTCVRSTRCGWRRRSAR